MRSGARHLSTAAAKQSSSWSSPLQPLVSEGRGGRSSTSGITATVFGATGFLGRYVVNALGRIGSQVIVPYRGDELAWRHLKVMGDLGQIVPVKYDPRNLASVERAISHSNVVINLIGNQRSTQNYSLDDTNRKIARLVARVAKEHHVSCYVHVSDLRADLNSPSEFARLKAQAELEVREINPDSIIIRPAPLFGAEDKLTNPYGILLRYWSRSVPMICGTGWHMNPIFAGDAARHIVKMVKEHSHNGKTVELVGPHRFNHEELCEKIAEMCILNGRYRLIHLPPALVTPVLGFTDHFPRFRPMWSAQDILMRQGRDACASPSSDGVSVVTGEQGIETSGLLWLRRFREARSMNQVVGDGGEFIHPYKPAKDEVTHYGEMPRRE